MTSRPREESDGAGNLTERPREQACGRENSALANEGGHKEA